MDLAGVDDSRSSPRTTWSTPCAGVVDDHGEVVRGHAVVAPQHDVVDGPVTGPARGRRRTVSPGEARSRSAGGRPVARPARVPRVSSRHVPG